MVSGFAQDGKSVFFTNEGYPFTVGIFALYLELPFD